MGKPVQETKTSPLASFDPRAFSKLLQGRGLWYRWSRALTCPCLLNSETRQWDPTCTRCGGDGWLYVNPCAAENRHDTNDYIRVRCIFSSVSGQPTVTDPVGAWDNSVATLTVQNEMRVGFRDRFVSEEQEMAWSEQLVRGADLVPIGRNGRSTTVQKTAMRYEPIRVNYVEDDDGAGNPRVYYQGTDFDFVPPLNSEPAHMKWRTGLGPPDGTLYTIHYDIRPVWVVEEFIFSVQNSKGPASGLKGADVLQILPTTFKVRLDFLTQKRGAT